MAKKNSPDYENYTRQVADETRDSVRSEAGMDAARGYEARRRQGNSKGFARKVATLDRKYYDERALKQLKSARDGFRGTVALKKRGGKRAKSGRQ